MYRHLTDSFEKKLSGLNLGNISNQPPIGLNAIFRTMLPPPNFPMGQNPEKYPENCKTVPWEHIGCQCDKLFLLKYVTITTVPAATVATVTITTVTVTTVTITTVTIN